MFKKILSSMLALAFAFGGAAALPGADTDIDAAASDKQVYASEVWEDYGADSSASKSYYRISPDKKKWKDISSTQTNVDCAYSYIGDTSNYMYATASFNIIAKSGSSDLVDIGYYGEEIKKQYAEMGYKVTSSKKVKFNGHDAYKILSTLTKDDFTMKLGQILINEGGVFYIISYGSEKSVFSKLEPEFDKALATFLLPGDIKSIANAKVTGLKSKYYSGKAIKQKPVVKLGKKTLKEGKDYTVSYKNNKAIGTATVTIKGKGAYKGSVKATFKICPKKTTLNKATSPKSKQLKVTYSKVKGVTGYQIKYSTSKKFTKKTTETVSSKKTSKTISKLTKGKTYYVKVRTYKTVNGVKYYSGYSDVKKVKIK